ncbi:HAMP domain-containing histidine kinase [Catenulispora sp. NL8]|uniref:histidine kinase n=1 Tax=Catenulispora pinistramenti TaxID=2705254 RepID=A0ABS5L6Q1_9ACTN|nr:HAMP domain-containing sensor histidine kinase [Catenulispora pinistramenti]MBS2554011.1 HAMP domain-containing histidine kinase [Catenulispora pinistramenti]
MTRRIALAFAALVAVLLVAAVLPLGAAMQSREEESFRFATISAARQVSAAAEETLVDHHPPDAMNEAVAAAERDGDCVGVFAGTGALVTATNCGTAKDSAAIALATRTLSSKSETTARSGDWLRAAVPVGDEDDSGAVVLARSAESLDHRVDVMWGWLALTAVACLALGVALAFALARWVSRPLLALDTTAARLGDGALDVRAPTEGGPPEVRRLARTFNRMAERTETLVHAHRGWVADVSHQLRTPLTALRLRLDVLAGEAAEAAVEKQVAAEQQVATAPQAAAGQQVAPEQQVAAAGPESPTTTPPNQSPVTWPGPDFAAELAGVQEEIERLSRLVDGLLAVARAEAVVARRVAVPVAEVAAERVSAWEPVAREHGQQLIAPSASRAAASLAPGDLEQILDNVIANALAAVPTGGHVRVDAVADRERDRVVLHVIDDGPGMSEAAKQSAFRRFGASSGSGSGLGLAIVDRLVTANGGEVRLADTVGGGLTVVVELPAASSAAPSDG